MKSAYDGRDYNRYAPSLRPNLPFMRPLLVLIVLALALVCLAAADKKRRQQPDKPVQPPAPPLSEHDEEAAIIEGHKATLKKNKSQRGTHPTGAHQLWQ